MPDTMDAALLAWLDGWRHPALTVGMSVVTWLGSLAFLLPLALVVGWRMSGSADWRRRVFLPAAVLGAAAMAHVLKWAVGRERPDIIPGLIPMPADASFPSAHAMQIAAFVAAWLLASGAWRQTGQIAAGAALVAVTGVSRLYLQVHFPSDVLAGILGGLLWAWALHRLPFWRAG